MPKLEDLLAGLDDDELAQLLEKRKAAKAAGNGRRVRVREFDVSETMLGKLLGIAADDDGDDDGDDDADDDGDDDGGKGGKGGKGKRGWFDL